MNRKIWDLLDYIQEDAIDLRESTPLSSERIKALTMGKIERNNNEEQRGTRTVKGMIGKALIAAILISSLAVTASAAGYSAQDAPRARGQILDKNGNVLKEVLLIKPADRVQGKDIVTDIVLLEDGGYMIVKEDVQQNPK